MSKKGTSKAKPIKQYHMDFMDKQNINELSVNCYPELSDKKGINNFTVGTDIAWGEIDLTNKQVLELIVFLIKAQGVSIETLALLYGETDEN